jgi:hypothetical protein
LYGIVPSGNPKQIPFANDCISKLYLMQEGS